LACLSAGAQHRFELLHAPVRLSALGLPVLGAPLSIRQARIASNNARHVGLDRLEGFATLNRPALDDVLAQHLDGVGRLVVVGHFASSCARRQRTKRTMWLATCLADAVAFGVALVCCSHTLPRANRCENSRSLILNSLIPTGCHPHVLPHAG